MSNLEMAVETCRLDSDEREKARAELAALRARVAAAETPKTCATCVAYSRFAEACQNPFGPTYGLAVSADFFCNNHAPITPEPTA